MSLSVPRPSVTLRVLIAEKSSEVPVDIACTVFQLKERILQDPTLSPLARGKRMRLIHSGRMLRDGDTLAASGVKADACIHVAVSDTKPSAAVATRPPGGSAGSPRRAGSPALSPHHAITIDNGGSETGRVSSDVHTAAPAHAGYNPNAAATADAPDDPDDPPLPAAGLNRLQVLGMDPEAIATLRSHFWPQIIALEPQIARRPNEEPADHLLRLEGVWMERQTADSEFGINIAPLVRQHAAQTAAAAANGATTNPSASGTAADVLLGNGAVAGASAAAGAGGGSGSYIGGGGAETGAGATAPQDTSFLQRMRALDAESEGTISDFLWGLMMGFFLGMLMLLWVAQESVSSKQKMGVFMGIFCNMALTLLRNSAMLTGADAVN